MNGGSDLSTSAVHLPHSKTDTEHRPGQTII